MRFYLRVYNLNGFIFVCDRLNYWGRCNYIRYLCYEFFYKIVDTVSFKEVLQHDFLHQRFFLATTRINFNPNINRWSLHYKLCHTIDGVKHLLINIEGTFLGFPYLSVFLGDNDIFLINIEADSRFLVELCNYPKGEVLNCHECWGHLHWYGPLFFLRWEQTLRDTHIKGVTRREHIQNIINIFNSSWNDILH